uniref:Probable beta-glucosidase G n=1 Tax=Prasinoderma coloniale TaxID=156133 RepID=A0A7R9TBI4_9VIRI|eukprot:PRCOL_00000096-RA
MLAKMTFDEKASLLGGVGYAKSPYVGATAGVARLGVPPLQLNDAGQGFRTDGQNESLPGSSTAFPCALAVAATFDEALAASTASAMAREFVRKGANGLLAPAVNVLRVPQNGRSFEYLSGEDPILGARLVEATVLAIQEEGIIATPKHFIDNSQEEQRQGVNEVVDGRTQRELYMRPFAAAARAGAAATMCSYNRINGPWACESEATLTGLLRKEAGFVGFVMSDWGGTHSTAAAIKAGMDQEMGEVDFFAPARLKAAIAAGAMSEADVDTAAVRVLTSMYAIGLMDAPPRPPGSVHANVTTPEHAELARNVSAASLVLLTNERKALPLRAAQRVAVIGDAAHNAPIVVGGGSGRVQPPYVATHLQGIRAAAIAGGVSYTPSGDRDAAALVAAAADVAVVVVGVNSSEGSDRDSLSLAAEDDALVEAVIAAQPDTVVVVCAPGPVLMPWTQSAGAVVLQIYGGQEAGNAVADVLYNRYSPTGRLPFTIPRVENERKFTEEQYPGVGGVVHYTEKLAIGYRWYDRTSVATGEGRSAGEDGEAAPTSSPQPAFYFGHGLTYTEFSYSDVSTHVPPREYAALVTASLVNVGSESGCELAQLYVSWPKGGLGADEPPAQLRGFERICLKAGQDAVINFEITLEALQLYDEDKGEWTVPSGEYEAFVAPCAGCLGAAAPVTFSIGTRASVVTRAEGAEASGGAPCRAGAVAAAQNAAAVAVM